MGVYNCFFYNYKEMILSFDEDNDISINLIQGWESNEFYLSRKDAQKLANELNHLLMEGKGNE